MTGLKLKKLRIRFRKYHDVFNLELQRRFYDCYKIDLIEADEIILSTILNSKSGIIYSGETSTFQLKERGSAFSSSHDSDLFLNGDFTCNYYISNPMRNLLSLKSKKHEVRFKDGRVVSFQSRQARFSFKQDRIQYKLFENNEHTGTVDAARKYVYFKAGSDFDYKGEILFEERYSITEVMLFLQLILLDCAYMEKKRNID